MESQIFLATILIGGIGLNAATYGFLYKMVGTQPEPMKLSQKTRRTFYMTGWFPYLFFLVAFGVLLWAAMTLEKKP